MRKSSVGLHRMVCLGLISLVLLGSSLAEARIGGGRSFGSRGSRGFSAPSYSRGSTYSRPAPSYGNSSSRPYTPPPPATPSYPNSRPSFLKSLGAGIAGGFLGSMLFRSLGGGSLYANTPGGTGGFGGGGGIGFLEIILVAGIAFLLIRYFTSKKQAPGNSSWNNNEPRGEDPNIGSSNAETGAEALMRQAKPYGYSAAQASGPVEVPSAQLDPESASDLFFKIQAAWGNRDLGPVSSILDDDAKNFLDQQITALKNNRRLNRLENIAVRNVDVVEEWKEFQKNYSTVRFVANVLDYTISEDTQQVIEGSKTAPVKFEEYWTFCKEDGGGNWKLSAIQQS
ncbi:MAG: Tim44 domain-containing protein [Bdellovibrio sp.]|nr:Tim44 domain-containing protein [Bdellovibrio sp.]